MSGHSKWANIKNQKGAADARRGQLFTKISREIILAVREHGSDPAGNPRLRLCIQKHVIAICRRKISRGL